MAAFINEESLRTYKKTLQMSGEKRIGAENSDFN